MIVTFLSFSFSAPRTKANSNVHTMESLMAAKNENTIGGGGNEPKELGEDDEDDDEEGGLC